MLSGKWSTQKILRRLFGLILNGTIFAVLVILFYFFRAEPPEWCDEKAIEAVKQSPSSADNMTIHQAVWRIYDLVKYHYHTMRIGKYLTREVPDRPDVCEVRLRYTIDDHPFTAKWTLDSDLNIIERNREAKKIENLETRH